MRRSMAKSVRIVLILLVHLILTTKWLKIEEEEMGKQINDGTSDECAYVKDDDLCA